MSSNKVEIGSWVFEVPDDVYDILMNGLKNYVKGEKQFFAPSPTVEISLEDAHIIVNNLNNWSYFLSKNKHFGAIPSQTITNFKQAISKAESKWNTSESVIKWANDGLGENLRQPLNKPALPIQDQVNELRGEISELKDTISQLQSVIEGMKSNLNAVKG